MIVVNQKDQQELLKRLSPEEKKVLEEGKEVTISDSFRYGWWIISKDGDFLCKRYKINPKALPQKGTTNKENPIYYQTNI